MLLEDYFEFEKRDDGERIRVKGTRVGIEILLEDYKKGRRPEEIQHSYPTVSLEEVYATITYFLHNQAEVSEYMRRSQELADAAYQEWLRTHKPSPLEERLRALRQASTKHG
jgi:uncharacterized protein (DUF433 family)